MAGYSDTSLLRKLGYRSGQTNFVDKAAPYFAQVKDDVTFDAAEPYEFIHIFVRNRSELEQSMTFALTKLGKTGMVWVSWPKKSSGVTTNIDENTVREFGLRHGIVDVKVAAIDDIWSGLKFVHRLKDRTTHSLS